MKPIIVVKSDADGKLILTAEELTKIVNEVYQSGYDDGKKSVSITYTPPNTQPNWCAPELTVTTATPKNPHMGNEVWYSTY